MHHILNRAGMLLLIYSFLLLAGCGNSPGETVDGEVVLGATKIADDDKIVILLGNDTNNYSGEANSEYKFKIKDVAKGTYKVRYIHYKVAPTVAKKGPAPGSSSPSPYPEDWTVPGGPFKLDLSKVKK